MVDDQAIQEMVNATVAKFQAEHEAAQRPAPPTPEEEIAECLSRARFRESIGEQALLHGVRPSSIRHVVRDAETVFEMREGAVVPRHNATDPNDPLSPLSPGRWLEQLAQSEPYLFAESGRKH